MDVTEGESVLDGGACIGKPHVKMDFFLVCLVLIMCLLLACILDRDMDYEDEEEGEEEDKAE